MLNFKAACESTHQPHKHTAMPLRTRYSIYFKSWNSAPTSEQRPSATPVGDRASQKVSQMATVKCLWTCHWKMSETIASRLVVEKSKKTVRKWFSYIYIYIYTIHKGTWCGRLFWHIWDHFGGDFPHLASIQGKACCMDKFRAYNASSHKTFLHLPEHGTRFCSGGFAGKGAYKSGPCRPSGPYSSCCLLLCAWLAESISPETRS